MGGCGFFNALNRKDGDWTIWNETEMELIQPLVFIVIIMLGALPGAADDDRGAVVRIQSEYDGAALHREFTKETNRALIIGINKYRHHPDLRTAVNDARVVADKIASRSWARGPGLKIGIHGILKTLKSTPGTSLIYFAKELENDRSNP